MHELSIARSLLGLVLEAAEGRPVLRITLSLGTLNGVVEDSLRYSFSLLAQSTAAQGACLEILPCPPRADCRQCHWSNSVDLPLPSVCPDCGGSLRFQGGMQLEVESIEVSDGDPHPDPNS